VRAGPRDGGGHRLAGDAGHEGDAGEPGDAGRTERRRPVGGAAAWRREPIPRVRAADDARPERERYARAPLGEQVRDGIADLRRNRALLAILTVLLGGFVVLQLLTPETVAFADLRAGDCLFVRAGDPDDGRPIGTASAVRAALLESGAERAACHLSHGHEVAAVVDLATGPWPGEAALAAVAEPACERAFAAHVATRSDGVATELQTIVPDEARWLEGARHAVCLALRRDGAFFGA
jgi:hypothetical protein